MKCCPACGQTLPPPCVEGFPPNTVKAQLYLTVRKAGNAGISSKKLFDELYGHNAGPLTGLRNIHVLVWQMNKALLPRHKKICSKGSVGGAGKYAIYYLRTIRCK